MAVITITITESVIQKVSGIPQTVELSTNVPATIFYTIDGDSPTQMSTIYMEPIELPTDVGIVVLKAFATDGTDTSSIITESYYSDTVSLRQPHDEVTGVCAQPLPGADLFPFGTNSQPANVIYGNTAGLTIDDPDIAGYPDGYDGTATGTHSNETDEPLVTYEIRRSDTDSQNNPVPVVGTLAPNARKYVQPNLKTSSDANSPLFDPTSLVIIQDGRDEPYDFPVINRQFYSSADAEKVRDGLQFNNTGFEGSVPTGSFVRGYYNEREQVNVFYYRDAENNSWIISKEPIRSATSNTRALTQVVYPSSGREGPKVFRWIPFQRRVLSKGS